MRSDATGSHRGGGSPSRSAFGADGNGVAAARSPARAARQPRGTAGAPGIGTRADQRTGPAAHRRDAARRRHGPRRRAVLAAGSLPNRDKLLSFAVSYTWQSCAATCVRRPTRRRPRSRPAGTSSGTPTPAGGCG